jgi:hypothetical protein
MGSFEASHATRKMNDINGAVATCESPALYDRVKGEFPEGTIPDVAKL